MAIHLQVPSKRDPLDQEDSREPVPSLRLGLVNNIQESAFASTEKQLLSLLDRASAGMTVSVSLYALPGMLPAGQERRYRSLANLMETELDGLVVTGREPLTRDLRDEAYWESFCLLLDWASKHTTSTLWSCLAAHAAVLHLDGIVRQRRGEKCCGVFSCRQVATHALTIRMPLDLRVPHSRWNGLSGEELSANGYKVLTSTHDGDADLFIKERDSLFVFAQGHPEYETDTLLREYRRDIGRYVRNESQFFPAVPAAYFDAATEVVLASLRERAPAHRREALLAESLAVLDQATVENTWSASAEWLYRDWLAVLAARSQVRVRRSLMTNTTAPSTLFAL